MACPMRVLLAGFSAMLALLIVWRAHSGDDNDNKRKMVNVSERYNAAYGVLQHFFQSTALAASSAEHGFYFRWCRLGRIKAG